MQEAGTSSVAWSVGELSAATGLSVRVLRHWERAGLFSPVRTAAGHRRYGPAEITRLYQAMALRRTGLSLRRIALLLHQQDPDPGATLRQHLAEIDDDLRRRGELRDRLARVLQGVDASPDSSEPDSDPGLLTKVIETMTMFEQYVHGHRPHEHLRLYDQADTLLDVVHDGVAYPAGSTVLEVGCGVGAQTLTLATRNPATQITSIDLSSESLTEARRRTTAAGITTVTFTLADVYDLPHQTGELAAQSFDHVFVCFVLEHLPHPTQALRRLHDMLKPGGTITVVEGDHGSTDFHPDSAAARDAIAAQVALQRHAGGDALIGRRLRSLLVEAGYEAVEVEPRRVEVDATQTGLADSFIRRTFTAMIAGVREPAIAAGLLTSDRFDAGLRALDRTREPDGWFRYIFFRATAVRAVAAASR